MDIVMRQCAQHGSKLIVVGDARQAIYQWRGSVNAMKLIEGKTCFLSQSWRYGAEVARIASIILNDAIEIKGNPAYNTRVVWEFSELDTTKPYTKIFRTNSALLSSAIYAIESGEDIKIEIDTADFIKFLESAIALKQENPKAVKHDKIVPYPNWKALLQDAKDDPELKRIAGLVDGGGAYQALDALRTYVPSSNPKIIFTTAHKSKGREWEQVMLGDDFPSCYGKEGKWIGLSEEEQNLLYVACTRARLMLVANTTVSEIEHRYMAENYDTFSKEYDDEHMHDQAVHYGLDSSKQVPMFDGIV
jgi:superfamily I DNA/RNA helicase